MADDAAVLTPTITGEDGKQRINPEWERQRNENVEAHRSGKPAPAAAAVTDPKAAAAKTAEAKAAEAKPGKPEDAKTGDEGADKDGTGGQRVSPGVRREMNRLQRLVGELTGKNQLLQEMLDKGMSPKKAAEEVARQTEEKSAKEPVRKDFAEGPAGDVEFTKALAKFAGKEEADKGNREREQSESLQREINDASTVADQEKKELFSDWDDVAKQTMAAAEKGEVPQWQDFPAGHPNYLGDEIPVRPILSLMLAKTPLRARYQYHWMKHPEELEAMLEHADGSDQQILAFAKLGGKLEVVYAPKQKEQKSDKAAASAASNVKLHQPSQAIAPKVGSVTEPDVPMTIEKNGRQVLNPAWQRIRNERAGVRE